MIKEKTGIVIKDVSLVYDLIYDRTTSLKEYIVNLLHRRKFVDKKKDKLFALNKINLTIRNGERVGIIGLNGAGKSTLLKIISGILTPTEGSMEIKGNVQPLIEIGAGFNYEFSGRENIYLNGAMLGFSKKQIKEKEGAIIEFAEIGKFIDIPIKYYSSGMMLRLAFTIATMIHPEILILDEMLSAGDLEFMVKAKKRMDQLLNIAKILVIVSHDINLLVSLTTRTIVLDKGNVMYDGPTDSAIEFYKNLIASNIDQKEKKKVEEKKENIREVEVEDSDQKIIFIKETYLNETKEETIEIPPGNETNFFIEYEVRDKFDEFYINLHITDKVGMPIAHLRNDFSGIELKDFEEGIYKTNISIKKIPFKSDKYRYGFQLVGKVNDNLIIEESKNKIFKISGDRKKHILIDHEWDISKKNKGKSSSFARISND